MTEFLACFVLFMSLVAIAMSVKSMRDATRLEYDNELLMHHIRSQNQTIKYYRGVRPRDAHGRFIKRDKYCVTCEQGVTFIDED